MALTEWAAPSPAGSFLANWKASIASLTPPTAGSLSASQCLMPGHTATEYAIRVGDTPLRPHPHPGQPLDPKGRSCHGLPSAPPVYLSSH